MAQTINTFDDSKFYKTVDIMDVFPGSGYSTMLKILKREKVVELEPDIEDLPKVDEEESSEENVEHRIARGGIAGR